jgi:outer membrane protein assembly factor BamB
MTILPLAGLMAVLPVTSAVRATSVEPEAADLAALLHEQSGVSRGVCCVLGCRDPEVGLALAQSGDFLVHFIDPDRGAVEALNERLDDAGLYGRSAQAETLAWDTFPYADGMIDLIVATDLNARDLDQLPGGEVFRVLRPEGRAIIGCREDRGDLTVEALQTWIAPPAAAPVPAERDFASHATVRRDSTGIWAVLSKPPLEGADAWSHWEHGPDNNPVSTDQLIKAPYMTQWLGEPLYIGMPAITTAAGGRIFIAMGHIAHHEREEPWVNTLLARNGYNGTVLWQLKLPDGYMAHRSAFIATADTFYMINLDGRGVAMLDPQTGEHKGEFKLPGERGEWKWISMKDSRLYALIGASKDPAETTLVRSPYSHWSWGELSRGYYQDRVPWGYGQRLVAFDLKTRELLWSHREDQPVDSRAMTLGEQRIYFYGPDSHVACLDACTGNLIWTNSDARLRELIETPGSGLGSTPGFRSMCYALYTPEALFFEAQTRMYVVAVSLEDGHLLWYRKKTTNNPNMLYLNGQLVVGIGDDGKTLFIEPKTGKTIKDLGIAKHSCARLTATTDSLFCRGWPEGLARYDLASGRISFNGAFRPSCNDGMIGANGLLYTGPWLCDCNLSIMGRVALCSAGNFDFSAPASDDGRLDRRDPPADRADMLPSDDRDWVTYRGSDARSASTAVSVPDKVVRVWSYQPDQPIRPTAATAAGGLVLYAGDDGKVRAIDAATGLPRWSFRTGGPILQPPTIAGGMAYVGSGDGYVYAIDAGSGELVWRFRVAPRERRVMIYGNLCSTWPVNSGVLVRDGVAYAAAGIIDYDGTYLCALDAATGRLIWENDKTGHLDADLRKGVSAQGSLTVADGRLWMPGGNVISPASYDLQSGEYRGRGPGGGGAQSNRGEEIGLLGDGLVMFGGRLRYSAKENVVNPGRFEAAAIPPGQDFGPAVRLVTGKIPPAWNEKWMAFVDGRETVPSCFAMADVRGYVRNGDEKKRPAPVWSANWMEGRDTVALAMASDAVIAVCRRPGHRSLREHWSVFCLKPDTGGGIWEHPLSEPALAGGLLIDRNGRVIINTVSGGLICYGGQQAVQDYVHALTRSASAPDVGRQEAVNLLLRALAQESNSDARDLIVEQLQALGTDVVTEARRRGRLTEWQLFGPVPCSPDGHPIDEVLINEPEVDLSATHSFGGETLRWHPFATDTIEAQVDLYRLIGSIDYVAIYAYTEFPLPEDRPLLIKLGSDDGFRCWLNGELIDQWDGARGYWADQNVLSVQGRKGVNRLLLKITQREGGWSFGVRVTDMSGQPVDLNPREPAGP